MRRFRRQLIGFAWFVFVLMFVSVMIGVAFSLTGYVYEYIHWRPPVLLTHIINALLGLLIAGMLVGTVGKVARSRGWLPEMQVFGPIMDALEKIT